MNFAASCVSIFWSQDFCYKNMHKYFCYFWIFNSPKFSCKYSCNCDVANFVESWILTRILCNFFKSRKLLVYEMSETQTLKLIHRTHGMMWPLIIPRLVLPPGEKDCHILLLMPSCNQKHSKCFKKYWLLKYLTNVFKNSIKFPTSWTFAQMFVMCDVHQGPL